MKKCNLKAAKKQIRRDIARLENEAVQKTCEAMQYEELVLERKFTEKEYGIVGNDFLEIFNAYTEILAILKEFIEDIEIKKG